MTDPLKQYVQQIVQLPTIPFIAQEILRLVYSEHTSINRLESIIENDPAISAKILSVANSAFFGYKVSSQTVNNAILRIGFNNVRDIALGVSLMSVFESEESALEYQRIFNHSVTVGAVAQFISKDLKMKFSEDIFVSGILHDLGYLIMNKYFPANYRGILNIFEKEKSLLEAEKTVLGFNHTDLGAWLAEKWGLPDGVMDSILYHHGPSHAKKNVKRVAVMHIADYIVSRNIMSPVKTDPNYPLDTSSLTTLEISEEYLTEVQEKMSAGEDFEGNLLL